MGTNQSQEQMDIEENTTGGNPNPEIAKLIFGGKALELPVVTGTEQERGIDITPLRNETGVVTIDPGFANTASCLSDITFLDGERGILRYRGIPIEELAESATYTEVAYLLIYGSLPPERELERFTKQLKAKSVLPKGIEQFYDNFPKTAHPMAELSALTTILSGYYPELLNPTPTREEIDEIILTILAQFPILAANRFRGRAGKELVASDADLGYVPNLLQMMFGKSDDIITRAFQKIMILHADHEQNCSTSSVRLVGSSRANAFVSISAGINALWGPLHGGANQAVIEMLEVVQKGGGDFSKYLAMAKDKQSGFRLMGFGHRVYKNYDPRAKILKAACDQVLGHLGIEDPLLDLAKQLEEAALQDEYFVERKLYPNVDFYSGIILRAIGIPTEYFTVVFALGRMAGWLAHWHEMLESPMFRIGRPRQIYTGPTGGRYTPVAERD